VAPTVDLFDYNEEANIRYEVLFSKEYSKPCFRPSTLNSRPVLCNVLQHGATVLMLSFLALFHGMF